jgi:hypothetical protein
MRYIRSLPLVLLLWLCAFPVQAAQQPDPQSVYTAALASAAAYDDLLGRFASIRLERQGWQLRRFSRQTRLADSQILLASKVFPSSEAERVVHVLAFRGTEKKLKDIVTDFAAELIFFYPSPTRLVTVYHNNKELAADVFVHRGFQAYADTAVTIPASDSGDSKLLIDELKSSPNSLLIITGHSLGGAAATLFGGRLLESGVSPNQMQVISFGAPPVGNIGFSKRYSETLPLTRVVNPFDLVAHLSEPVQDGVKRRPEYADLMSYVQFGEQMTNPVTIQDELRQHAMRIYVDYAARAVLTNQSSPVIQPVTKTKTLLLTVKNTASFNGGHLPYMTMAVRQIIGEAFHGWQIISLDENDTAPVQADYSLQLEIGGKQLESSTEGGVSVQLILRQREGNAVWAASRHVTLNGELSPLSGVMLAIDSLTAQIPEHWFTLRVGK